MRHELNAHFRPLGQKPPKLAKNPKFDPKMTFLPPKTP